MMSYRMAMILKAAQMAWFVFKIKAFGSYKNSIWDGVIDHTVWEYKGNAYYLPQHSSTKYMPVKPKTPRGKHDR